MADSDDQVVLPKKDKKHKDHKHKKDKKDKKHKKDKKDKKDKKHKKDKKDKEHREKKSDRSEKKEVAASSRKRKSPETATTTTTTTKKVRRAVKRTEDDFEPTNRWWEETSVAKNENERWESLEHQGMLFTPEYIAHRVPLVYKGEAVRLSEGAEEVATFYAQSMGTPWSEKKKFVDNFWGEFRAKMSSEEKKKIVDMKECDFGRIRKYIEEQSAARKSRSKEEKEKEKEDKNKVEIYYTHALLNISYRERIGNFRVEPPNLFKGRGEHPKMGILKKRIMPEDVIVNTGPDAPAPKLDMSVMPGRAYKEIVHDNTVTWLAWYEDSVNGNFKYVFLNAASGFKGQSDWIKYERARRLKKYIAGIRADYEKKLKSADKAEKQLGTAVYLIDRLALRVGNEKNTEEEADTVGCCSLRVEHLRFVSGDVVSSSNNSSSKVSSSNTSRVYQIELDFLGKDSIRYLNTVEVAEQVYKNLQEFTKNKRKETNIFDIDPDDVNKYFKAFMSDLSAKVFRTYNASVTLEAELTRLMQGGSAEASLGDVPELVKFYNDANRRVAVLCNHQRAPPKQHEEGMKKLVDKRNEAKELLDLLEVWSRHSAAKKEEKMSEEDRKKGKEKKFGDLSEEQLMRRTAQQKLALERIDFQIREKEENKSVSLTTSKINYMDPRITVAFCKKFELPIEKIFAKTIRNKFPWAMHTKSNYSF